MPPIRSTILLLATGQGLLSINGVTLIAVSGLAGAMLADNPAYATLPVTGYALGAAMSTVPASWIMQRMGRRFGFRLGSGLGLCGSLLCALALWIHQFWLLCAGCLFAGFYNAFGQQYRFAAADAASEEWKSRAVSYTLTGGILGGVLGPELSKLTWNVLPVPFTASYLTLTLVALLSWMVMGQLHLPQAESDEKKLTGRPLGQIIRQPAYLVAVIAAVSGSGIMNLLMTATPLVMKGCQLPFQDAAFVLEWHVLGMFVPSFVTGTLILRFGVLPILILGALVNLLCVTIAMAGVSLLHFWGASLLLGIGWNFLYIGGTTLLTTTYLPEEKAKAQGLNELLIFLSQIITSFASGVIANQKGWQWLNAFAVPVILLTLSATIWLMIRSRKRASGTQLPYRSKT
ncbi:MAG: MFS transporter [Magnetococcales bacterium]|nr:MFS transporter [Magnetococcales bacterium]